MSISREEMLYGAARAGGKSSVLRDYLKANPEAVLGESTGKPFSNAEYEWVKNRFIDSVTQPRSPSKEK